MKALALIQEDFSRKVEEGLRKNNIISSCKKGCFACCDEPAYVDLSEILYLLEDYPEAKLEGLRERLKKWLETATQSGILNEAEPHVMKYKALKLTCPLLENGLCSVYARRPLACRAHAAVGPAHLCADDRMNQRFVSLQEPIAEAVLRIMQLRGKSEMDNMVAHLVRCVLGIDVVSVPRMGLRIQPTSQPTAIPPAPPAIRDAVED